jgi:hypothetical protein
MKRIVVAATGLAAVLSICALTERADAAIFGNPAGLVGAAEELALTETIHCRPGRWHHRPNRYRRADGCAKRGAVIVVPGRERYVIRDGVRVRVGTGDSVRSRTTIRTRTDTSIRSRSGTQSDTGTRATTRSSTTSGGSVRGADRPNTPRDTGGTGADRAKPRGAGDSREAPAQQSPAPSAR